MKAEGASLTEGGCSYGVCVGACMRVRLRVCVLIAREPVTPFEERVQTLATGDGGGGKWR